MLLPYTDTVHVGNDNSFYMNVQCARLRKHIFLPLAVILSKQNASYVVDLSKE